MRIRRAGVRPPRPPGAAAVRTSKYGSPPFSFTRAFGRVAWGGVVISLSRRWTPVRNRRRASSRGVSDVIATILLLGLTVTLFASIFFFVNSLPPPPAQAQNQFSSSLVTSGTLVMRVQVTHLAGPVIPATGQIYITSAAHPAKNPPVFTVGQGIANGTAWALGQVWTKDISAYGLTLPDNITVSIVSQSVLLYRNTLPGASTNVPPTFVGTGYSPLNPTVGQSFVIFTQIVDNNLKTNSVYINVSQLSPGLGKPTFPLTYSASTGLWSYTVPAGLTTRAGTFFVFINASDTLGQLNSVTIPVTILPAAGLISVQLSASPVLLVTGSPVTLIAQVTNFASGSGNITVTFTAGATLVSTQNQLIPPGGTQVFTASWTPATAGVYSIVAAATAAGGGAGTASLNETAFPPILLLAHNVPVGTNGNDNTSARLALELSAAGIPFSSRFVPCSSALASSMFSAYKVAIVDFGATWTGGCPKAATSTDQNAITGATGTAVWVVGSNAFGATACNSYSSAFFSKIGASWTSGSTCVTLPNATGSLTYSASLTNGVRADGVPGTIGINRTLSGISTYVPYDSFTIGAVGSNGGSYAKVGTSVVGTFSTASPHGAALASEPALLTTQLPNGNSWGSGVAGSAIVYNIVDYLCGLSNSSAAGRALSDFGIAQATHVGVNHLSLTQVYVGVRSNGAFAGAITATLMVNGAVALLGGAPVVANGTVGANGAFVFLTLTWQAPSAGSFTLSVTLSFTGVADLYAGNNQLGISIINQPTTFA